MAIKVGFSSCPNDTFIWAALVNKFIEFPFDLDVTITDIEALNRLALKESLDIIKVSCHLLPYILDKYCFLTVGAALGRGCGPLLIANPKCSSLNLKSARIAIPGEHTTAYFLFKLYAPDVRTEQIIFCFFDEVIPKLLANEADFGVIIHEGRFIFKNYGLKFVLDLGKWWEEKTKLPLPLGGIIVKKELGEKIKTINAFLKKSISYAWQHPEKIMPYVKKYAAHLEDDVIQKHINLYVNEFTLELGKEGKMAIIKLLEMIGKEIRKEIFC